jgi:hypothetical protein
MRDREAKLWDDINGLGNSSEINYKMQFTLESFKNIQELIRFTDQKAGAILVIYGLIITVFVEYIHKLTFVMPFEYKSFFENIISVVTLGIGMIISIALVNQLYNILYLLKPRLAMNYKEHEYSVYYFEHIAHMKKVDLINRLNNLSQIEGIGEIAGQIHEVSKIMIIKTHRLGEIIKNLFYIIIFLLLFILLIEIL